jgi:hypothetical protein
MPSARDLLQQADALMRSHRNVGSSRGDDSVPVLTDIAVPGNVGAGVRPRVEDIPVLTHVVSDVAEPAFDMTVPVERERTASTESVPAPVESLLLPLSEMPELPPLEPAEPRDARDTDDAEVERTGAATVLDDETPKWLEADLLPPTRRDESGESAAVPDARHPDAKEIQPASESESEQHDVERLDWASMPMPSVDALMVKGGEGAGPAASSGANEGRAEPDALAESIDDDAAPDDFSSSPEPSGSESDGSELTTAVSDGHVSPLQTQTAPSAAEVAETVYFQVLQNLDLYTERALQRHMTAHLSPIIERATQDLLTTLNANLGALIRQFVADAIEKQLGVRPAAEAPSRED